MPWYILSFIPHIFCIEVDDVVALKGSMNRRTEKVMKLQNIDKRCMDMDDMFA